MTNLVAGSPHPIQNLDFFSTLDVKGSILFNVFTNNYIFSNYVEGRYIINHIEQLQLQDYLDSRKRDSNSLGKVL